MFSIFKKRAIAVKIPMGNGTGFYGQMKQKKQAF